MRDKMLDHLYHRSRVDAQITGNICLVAIVGVLALTLGEQFEPFRYGANWFEPVRLVWVETMADSDVRNTANQTGRGTWVLEQTLHVAGNFPPAQNRGPLFVRVIRPVSLSVVLVIGTLAIAYFIYASARRQTRLMNAVFANDSDMPYQRRWEEIRVTFWALDVTLAFILFFLLM